jgi:hypothetical protein
MLSANNKINEDVLKLQSFALPPLPAGTYQLKSTLKVGKNNKGIPGSTDGPGVSFSVQAPQFGIDLALVHSVYPAAGSAAAYQTTMPHMVLKRKTLPWERSITGNADNKKPWLCLLLLNEDELTLDSVKKIRINDLRTAAPGTIIPQLPTEDTAGKTAEIKVLEIPAQLFKDIAPRLAELDFLTHTRQADTTSKEDNQENGYGWYSVLVGNRLPTPEKYNTVFLISLEGHNETLQKNETAAAPTGNIRLVVLHQWLFKAGGASFKQLLGGLLDNNATSLNAEPPKNSALTEGIKNALKFGYVPLNHAHRDGSQSLSWYRGPLVPMPIPVSTLNTYKNADQAVRFDQPTSMFDISYAAAWQLGRLLALQDSGFSSAISDWKNAYKRDRPVEIAKDVLNKTKDVDMAGLNELISDIESDEVLTDYLIQLWAESAQHNQQIK